MVEDIFDKLDILQQSYILKDELIKFFESLDVGLIGEELSDLIDKNSKSGLVERGDQEIDRREFFAIFLDILNANNHQENKVILQKLGYRSDLFCFN